MPGGGVWSSRMRNVSTGIRASLPAPAPHSVEPDQVGGRRIPRAGSGAGPWPSEGTVRDAIRGRPVALRGRPGPRPRWLDRPATGARPRPLWPVLTGPGRSRPADLGTSGPAGRPPCRPPGALPQPGAVVARLRGPAARPGGRRPAPPARAGQVPGHLRRGPRRVLPGAGGRAGGPGGRRPPDPVARRVEPAPSSWPPSPAGPPSWWSGTVELFLADRWAGPRPPPVWSCPTGTPSTTGTGPHLGDVFDRQIFPILTPLAVGQGHPVPRTSPTSRSTWWCGWWTRRPVRSGSPRVKVPPAAAPPGATARRHDGSSRSSRWWPPISRASSRPWPSRSTRCSG